MGAVAVTLRILPESSETDVAVLKDAVRSALRPKLRSLEEQPIAFGLTAVLAIAIVEDAAGGTEGLEQTLAALPGVGSVETIDVTLV